MSRTSLSADHAAFATAARPASYALVNGFLAQHAILSEALAMKPAKMIVYLTICTAAVQRVIRDPALPEGWRGTARMPRSVIGYISRRGIAEATGLPRENVRRIVDELLAEGRLLTGPRGAVANKGGLLESQLLLDALQRLLAEHARTGQRLVDAGVLSIVAAEASDELRASTP
jgi:hypothetical protein